MIHHTLEKPTHRTHLPGIFTHTHPKLSSRTPLCFCPSPQLPSVLNSLFVIIYYHHYYYYDWFVLLSYLFI